MGLVEREVIPSHGKGEHLFEGILALTRKALPPLILHRTGGIADHGHNAPEKEIDLLELREPLQGPFGHEAVVGVVEHGLPPRKFITR